jgi:hypothetical protein
MNTYGVQNGSVSGGNHPIGGNYANSDLECRIFIRRPWREHLPFCIQTPACHFVLPCVFALTTPAPTPADSRTGQGKKTNRFPLSPPPLAPVSPPPWLPYRRRPWVPLPLPDLGTGALPIPQSA